MEGVFEKLTFGLVALADSFDLDEDARFARRMTERVVHVQALNCELGIDDLRIVDRPS